MSDTIIGLDRLKEILNAKNTTDVITCLNAFGIPYHRLGKSSKIITTQAAVDASLLSDNKKKPKKQVDDDPIITID